LWRDYWHEQTMTKRSARSRLMLLLPLLALAGCDTGNSPGVGGVTRSEAEALNDAATMLDQANKNAVEPVKSQ
jgi:hypothetical protein